MDLMLPRLNALRDSEDEAAIAGAEYRHSTRLSGMGVSLKDDAKALGMGVSLKDDAKALGMGVSVKSDADMLNMGVSLKDDANELGMGVIDSAGSAHVVMSSQDKVIVGHWLVRAALNVALSRGANKNKLLRGTGIFEDALKPNSLLSIKQYSSL
ncbi:MAG: AraC family transcriptional regulator, partial [Alteromonas sp.]